MAIVPAFRKRILSVGSVPIYRMAWSTATVGDSVEYPQQDQLDNDRFFRYYFHWRLLWNAGAGASDTAITIALLTEADAQSIWQRRWAGVYGATGATTSKDYMAWNEHIASNVSLQSAFAPEKMIYPPGMAIRASLSAGNAGSQVDLRCLCAEARDPDELKQVIGHEISNAIQ